MSPHAIALTAGLRLPIGSPQPACACSDSTPMVGRRPACTRAKKTPLTRCRSSPNPLTRAALLGVHLFDRRLPGFHGRPAGFFGDALRLGDGFPAISCTLPITRSRVSPMS